MRLVAPTERHLQEMMSWFTDEDALRIWAGPSFRYPFDLGTFTEDIQLSSLASFSLVDNEASLLAFGQCYLRVGRCHVGRLAVAPDLRGKGLASNLISLLSEYGMEEFGVDSTSLFVLAHNKPAISAYKSCGFEFFEYPEHIPLENCLYMVRA